MGKGSNTTTTNQTQTYNPAGASQIQGALTQAQQAAQLPFNIPQAPVAGFSQDQQTAFGNINAAQGMAQPYINQAQQYFSPQGAQQFFNPYADAVTAQMQNIFGQQNSQNTGQLTQAAGGVGADRIAVGQGNLANQQGLAAGQTYANLYGQSVQQAQAAGYGTAALGSQAQNAALSGAQAQLASGGLQQQLQQAQLNAPYQQQLAQAAFPYQQAQFLAGITGSLAPGLGGTTSGQGTTTSPSPSMLSQILGLGTAGVGAAGGLGAFGGSPSYGGGSAFKGDAYGGSGSNPLPGLSALDYGSGYKRGGYVGYAEGGETESSPFDLPPNFNDKPINVAQNSIIPEVKTPAIQAHIPQLNLNPPQQSGGSGGGGLGDIIGAAAKIVPFFLSHGGRVNPYARGGVAGFADGGAAFGTLSPGEEAERPPNILDNAVSSGIGSLATLPKRAIDASAQDVQHLGDPDYQRQSIGPALETAMTMTGGAGAIPAEANTLRAGLKLPAGYYDKVPMDMRMSRKGVSHPGLRWEVYDSKTGEVVRKDLTTRSGASMAQDRLDNKYGGYKYQVRPTQAKELTDSEAQFLKDKDISFDEPGMARGGRTKNPYAFADGGTPMEDAEWPVGPIGGPSDVVNFGDPIRSPGEAAINDWRRGVDADIGRSGNDGMSATPVSYKPAFPPPSGAHGRSVGAPAIETPADVPQDMSASSPSPVAPQEGTRAGKEDRFIDSPWAALMAAGLGIASGTSPFAGVNIGQGALQGLKTLETQRTSGQKDETIAQATRRLDLEAKHHEDQFTRMTPYQQIEALKPVKIGVDLLGRDVMARRDAKSGQYINTMTNKPIDPDSNTLQVPPNYKPPPGGGTEADAELPPHARLTQGFNAPEGVRPEILAQLPPQRAATIRAIDEGRQSLTSVPLRDRQAVIDALNAYDPNFDQTTWATRNAQQKDMSTNGNAGKMILAVNQLLPHLKKASDTAEKLNNSNYPAANTIKNWYATQTGDPRVKTFETVREVASMDAARLLRGSGAMAEQDIDFWRKNLASADSPATLQTIINTLADDLMGARISSIQHSYRTNMRMEPPDFISKEAKEALAAIKGRQSGAAQTPAAGAPPAAAQPATAAPAAAAPQVGEVRTNAHGKKGRWNGSGWETVE